MNSKVCKPKATITPRAAFAAASFDNLRAAALAGSGDTLCIALSDIDEDPEQPRTRFEDEALATLADSIRTYGVVQPIVVRPPVAGRYRLVVGARRLRAARMAGKTDIPAIISATGDDALAIQVLENQQRAGLCNSDLACAVTRLTAAGATIKQIATICSIKEYQVTVFRAAVHFPAPLTARMDTADMRALYDLFRQWNHTPTEVLERLPPAGTYISITEARRMIDSIQATKTSSHVLPYTPHSLQAMPLPAVPAKSVDHLQSPPPQDHASTAPTDTSKVASRRTTRPHPENAEQSQAIPVFIVCDSAGRIGRLIVDRKALQAAHALVAFTGGIEEVAAAALRIVRIE